MSKRPSRDEIAQIYGSYNVKVDYGETTENSDLRYIIENLKSLCTPFERPDAYVVYNNTAYGIEHFQISQYNHKKGDQGKVAEAAKQKREKLKEDRRFDLKPGIQNLYDSLKSALSDHMKNADVYKANVETECKDTDYAEYRLVLVIEDASDLATYVEMFDTTPRNPLFFDAIAEMLLSYEGILWGIIYIGGSIKDKTIKGYTLSELKEKKEKGKLLEIGKYRTMHAEDERMVSKEDESGDEHTVTIKVYDRLILCD